jgi:hypothetical protein
MPTPSTEFERLAASVSRLGIFAAVMLFAAGFVLGYISGGI